MKFTILCLSLLTGVSALARVAILPSLKVESDIPAWTKSFNANVQDLLRKNSYPAEGYVECRTIVEVTETFLCQSYTRREMNSALGRASFFIEGLGDPSNRGQLKRLDDPTYNSYKDLIGGHDLRGSDLLPFYQQVEAQCASSHQDPQICADPQERDLFQSLILPQAQMLPNFVVITFDNESGLQWKLVITHEVMHAQYFNQPIYRAVVDSFWDHEVPETDKQKIRSQLGQYYDSTNELLMKNEFQAYILMSGAQFSELANFVSTYRAPLMKRLQDKGVTPVQVH